MKVVQINTVCGYGSTGSIVIDLVKELKKYNVETKIIYGQNNIEFENGYNSSILIENKIHSIMSRLLGIQGFFSWIGTIRAIDFIKKYGPDIVHIHNLHGNYICYPLLFRYLSKKQIPIVYTLHDCWPFTGKCAHYADIRCNKWKIKCYHCPKVRSYPPSYFIDLSSFMYKVKKYIFNKLDKVIAVGVSDWIANEARKSFINGWDIRVVYNWIDISIFKPQYNADYLQRVGIREDEFIILGVCGKWSKAKGILDWLELGKYLSEKQKIVLIGKIDKSIVLPPNCIHISYTENREELAILYTRAQVFLNLSEAESFGKTTAEALACGTPVIVYDRTACPELVGPSCGYVVKSLPEVVRRIQMIQDGQADINQKLCRRYAVMNFDIKENIKRYYYIYKEAIELK